MIRTQRKHFERGDFVTFGVARLKAMKLSVFIAFFWCNIFLQAADLTLYCSFSIKWFPWPDRPGKFGEFRFSSTTVAGATV